MLTRCADRLKLVAEALGTSNVYMIGELSGFAELDLAQGKRKEAIALLTRALEALESVDARPAPGDVETLLLLVAQFCEHTEIRRARVFLDHIIASSSVPSTASYVALFEALEQLRFGDHSVGVARANAAAERFRAIGWPLYEARALEAAGREGEALEIFKRIGDVYDVRRLEAILYPVDWFGRATREMTGRERQISELVIKGHSNRAIAHQLALSERTVAQHVSSILMKAAVRSRAELIAKLVSSSPKT